LEKSLDTNFSEIINMIETRRINAYRKVNEELIGLYWDFGKYISEKVNDSNWGDKIVDKLVEFMKREYPTMKGFNRAGIYRMKQFYETYKDNEIVAPLVRQISWTHNVMILGATNSIEEKEFYIRMCIKNNYSKRELDRQISSGYFQRYMLSDGKANQSLTKTTGEEDYPNTRILDTYSLEFLDLPNNYSEKDLKKSIISNMKDFILEIGKDFTYVGEPAPVIDSEIFNRIFEAVKNHRTVTFQYRSISRSEYKDHTFNPYQVICRNGDWYVIGFCHNHYSVRTYSLARMKNLEVTNASFELPEDFDMKNYRDLTFGVFTSKESPVKIHLHFNQALCNYVLERKWHETQEIEQNEDGSVELKFMSNQLEEICRLMRFGSAVKVIEPENLVEMVKNEAQKISDLYRG